LYGSSDKREKTSDYVVSSYAPTITSILYRSKPYIKKEFQILAVAQASKSNPIPGVRAEVKRIQSLAGDIRVENLVDDNATVDRVLQAMKDNNWIHLACHGTQNAANPMKSGFLLQDDNTLELSRFVRDPLPKAEFAFLSACQTATGDAKVAEESAHLAAGMLFSGCRGVIATMWSIQDKHAPQVAEDVYTRMLEGGKPERKKAAYALHEAIKKLRESRADFSHWVPYIHIGR
jgi:CHAT domain-containing protein